MLKPWWDAGSCILAASSLSPGQLAYSEKVGPLLSRQKATRPSEYILGPLSSESEEEVEGGPPGDQPLRRAGSGSLVDNREPPKPHVRVRIEEDPKGGIGGETICPIEPELGVEVEERGGGGGGGGEPRLWTPTRKVALPVRR